MQYAAADEELDGGRCGRPPASGSSAKSKRAASTFHSREERPPSTSTAPAPLPATSGHGVLFLGSEKVQNEEEQRGREEKEAAAAGEERERG